MDFFGSLFTRQPQPSSPPTRPQYYCSTEHAEIMTTACSESTVQKVEILSAHMPDLWRAVQSKLVPNNTTLDIQNAFLSLVRERGLTSAFRGYLDFPEDLTISVNHEVINTLPSSRRLRIGDLVKIQFGLRLRSEACIYQAWSFTIGQPSTTVTPLLVAGREALDAAIVAARPGVHVGEVSFVIHDTLARSGFWPSEDYVGHGIGTSMHMKPPISCNAPQDIGKTPLLTPGTLLSLVVLTHACRPEIRIARDRWSVVTIDNSLSTLFSHVVLIGQERTTIITPEVTPRN